MDRDRFSLCSLSPQAAAPFRLPLIFAANRRSTRALMIAGGGAASPNVLRLSQYLLLRPVALNELVLSVCRFPFSQPGLNKLYRATRRVGHYGDVGSDDGGHRSFLKDERLIVELEDEPGVGVASRDEGDNTLHLLVPVYLRAHRVQRARV